MSAIGSQSYDALELYSLPAVTASHGYIIIHAVACRVGIRTCLPAGFGSGWDNFRGTLGHINTHRLSVAENTQERDTRRRQLLSALQRQPLEQCRLPNEVHCGMGVASGAANLDAHAGVLKGCSASVTAYSPNGLLLAVAVEEAPKQWSVKACSAQPIMHGVDACMHAIRLILQYHQYSIYPFRFM